MVLRNCKILLISGVLVLSANICVALPKCSGSPTSGTLSYGKIKNWDSCIGDYEWRGFYINGKMMTEQILGVYKNGKANGRCYITRWNHSLDVGHTSSGNCVNNLVVSGKKTYSNRKIADLKIDYNQFSSPVKRTLTALKSAFITLPSEDRKRVQKVLKSLELYRSAVDGLYGRGTAAALTAYNKQKLAGADLNKTDNAARLMKSVLAFNSNSAPKVRPQPKVEPLPDNSQAPKPAVAQPDQPNKTYKVASGTGFYVSDEGHIITNHHVIDGCRDMKVHSKGVVMPTVQIAADKQNDLALLKNSTEPSHVFALSDNSPFPLQEVIVAGFPFGDKYSSSLKFTQGIVSSLTGLGDNYSEIQIDAALQQGNSGGPIIDEYGNIVAVAVAKLDAKYMFDKFGIIPENTNFGVKASAVRNLMEGNRVPFKPPNTAVPSRQQLSQQATDGTVFLTCWMTMAQVEKLRSEKVMFEDVK